jgi:hypothetical protein
LVVVVVVVVCEHVFVKGKDPDDRREASTIHTAIAAAHSNS